jgi:hypothetical protein
MLHQRVAGLAGGGIGTCRASCRADAGQATGYSLVKGWQIRQSDRCVIAAKSLHELHQIRLFVIAQSQLKDIGW